MSWRPYRAAAMRLTPAALAIVVLCVAGAPPAALAAPAPAQYSLPGGAVFPEGVAVRPGTRTFFVSSTNGGAIYRGTTDRPRTRVFLTGGADGRTAAVGMKANRRGLLYVAGGATGRLYVYDTTTRRLVRAFDTNLRAPDSFVNDVTLAPSGDGRLLVVNSQFDARNVMRPPRLPFTVAGVRRP